MPINSKQNIFQIPGGVQQRNIIHAHNAIIPDYRKTEKYFR
jgi:hypothetical protein